MAIGESLLRGLARLYTGPVRRLGSLLGVTEPAERIYEQLHAFVTPNRLEVTIGPASARFATSSIGEYRRATKFIEEEALGAFLDSLHEDDVFWDVGANTGLYTCLAGSIITDGAIYAFEPHPGNVESLRTNVELNGLENIEVRRIALSDQSGEVELTVTSSKAGTGLHSLANRNGEKIIKTDAYTGDRLVANGILVPNVIKIDVEGGEGRVIDGLTETLARPECRLVYCEIHGSKALPNHVYDFGDTPEAIESRLRDAGFTLEIVDDGNAYMVKGWK